MSRIHRSSPRHHAQSPSTGGVSAPSRPRPTGGAGLAPSRNADSFEHDKKANGHQKATRRRHHHHGVIAHSAGADVTPSGTVRSGATLNTTSTATATTTTTASPATTTSASTTIIRG